MMNGDAARASKQEEEGPGRPPPAVDKRFFDIDWAPVYIQILENGRDWVRRALTAAAEWEGGIHYPCYTGKDRTGIFTALLLGLCGVDALDIMWDYALSMTCLRPFYQKMDIGAIFPTDDGTPDYTRGFYRTDPQTMETMLRHLEESCGGVAGYVRGCGVSEETIASLRGKLTEER
jgi:protein-tyrosine phosphatase